MTRLARDIATHVVADRGPEELLRHGVTTTVTGALNEGLHSIEHELGVYSQGCKGATSRKTPAEIRDRREQLAIDSRLFIYASRMAAEVDSATVQDGYQLYHHAFFFPLRASGASWSFVAPTLNLVGAEQEHRDGPRTRTV